MLDTKPLLYRSSSEFPTISRSTLRILQLNLGYRCNLSCTHCHVNAGPKRTETLSPATMDAVMAVLKQRPIETLDLTGGAPEMHPQFQQLVEYARNLNIEVIDRCNLTILNEPEYQWLAKFLAEQKVKVVASLPCYSEQNVDAQRGRGVFISSIEGLQKLNNLGYAMPGTELELDLVYNPGGAFLPPPQQALEQDYKHQLQSEHGIHFNRLLTLTNMPISRFGSMLLSKGEFDSYMSLLKDNYQQANIHSVMCKDTLSVDWRGYLYDCDFNQMLALPIYQSQNKVHVSQILDSDLTGHPITTADHCFGCTAGQGSSCGGALG